MGEYQVKSTAMINAPAARVYAIIADYHNGHPHILPKHIFTELVVEAGGVGQGTLLRFQMSAFGQTRTIRAAISEPEPGRLLVESSLDGGSVTTFTVDPLTGGQQAHVTIATNGKTTSSGVSAMIERFLTKRFLLNVYAQELKLLKQFAERTD